jgi:hypothetical protein
MVEADRTRACEGWSRPSLRPSPPCRHAGSGWRGRRSPHSCLSRQSEDVPVNPYLAKLKAFARGKTPPSVTDKTDKTPIGVGSASFVSSRGSPFSSDRASGVYYNQGLKHEKTGASEAGEKPPPQALTKLTKPLPAPLEAILDRFPGAEIVSLCRYDVPDHSQLEPLAPAGHVPGTCAQCRDGSARRWLDRRRNVIVWLHLECRRHYWLRGNERS